MINVPNLNPLRYARQVHGRNGICFPIKHFYPFENTHKWHKGWVAVHTTEFVLCQKAKLQAAKSLRIEKTRH